MLVLFSILAFILGGSIGFLLASVIAVGRVEELGRENENLKRKLEKSEGIFEVTIEQGHLDRTPSDRKSLFRQAGGKA
jgi:hypothetical protein